MLSSTDLPHLNAFLNASSALLLLAGYVRIRNRDRVQHRRFMLGALVSSSLFLTSYLIYHAHVGSVRFQGQGWIRSVYFAILISHSLLAAAAAPMVVITAWYALKSRFDRHKRIARWTFPIWVYVSLTGVAVYGMLYW